MKRQLVYVALLCAGLAGAQTPSSSQTITPNIQNTDISVVALSVTDVTGITFIVDASAGNRKISFPNRRPMSATEYYDTFLSILAVNGLAAVPAGRNTMKIVQEANARTMPGRELTGRVGPDELVHVVVTVSNVNAQQVATVLNQIRSQYGVVQAVPGTTQIIINDRAANVERMRRIIGELDRASSSDLDVIPLRYATADNLLTTLNQLLGGQQQAANQAAGIVPRLQADARTNSILVVGEPPARQQVKAWVASLDTPLQEGSGEPEVIYLKYGDAETLAPLLKEFVTGVAQTQAVAAAGGNTAAGGAAPAAAASSAADRGTTILAEPSTNALIITAPPKMKREVIGILASLDVPRQLVLLEGILAEVSTDKAADLGVNWAVFSDREGELIPTGGFIAPIGGVSIVNLASAISDPEAYLAGGGAVPNGATFGVGRIRNNGTTIAGILRALRTDGETNVIAEPKITALDNEEVVFQDGQEVPFLGSFTSYGGVNTGGGQGGPVISQNPISSVERQQIGTTLTMTAQINEGGSMTLDLQLESSELSGQTGDAGSAITNNRSIDTKVRVDDGQTIVLGGMVRNFEARSETRVPFLGRIPVLGELFKVRGAQRQQKMLMVFIRPTILRDATQVTAETRSKYNQLREAQQNLNDRNEVVPMLPYVPSPELPEIANPENPIQPATEVAPGAGATPTPVP